MKKIIFSMLMIAFVVISATAQWTTDPQVNTIVNNLSGSQAVPHIAYDSSGNFYVGFYSNESGNYNIRLQYYSIDGTPQWAADGILVSNHPQNSWVTEWDLATDTLGNCVLAFNDVRDGNANVYAYAISPSGSFLWGADGIALTTDTEDEFAPSITVTSDNNVIVAWSRPTSSQSEIVMQKITNAGSLEWGASGITYQTGTKSYTGPRVLGVENGNYLMGFYKESGSFPAITRAIYVQKFDTAGTTVWTSDVLASNANGISAFVNFTIASDNDDGIVLAWMDDRDSDNNIDGSVQRVQSDGSISWPANGSEVSTANTNSHQNIQILGVNSSDQVVVTWSKKNSNQSQTAVAGQKFSSTGSRLWTNNGIEFIPMSTAIFGPIGGAVFDGTSSIIAYDEYVFGSSVNSNIKAFAVDDAGSMLWSPTITLVAARTTEKGHATNSSLFREQLIVVWEEVSDIYMQNINTDGVIGEILLSNDATLSDLTVDGTTVPGFSPAKYSYSYPVVTGDPVPLTGATANDTSATVVITQAVAVPGQATVLVTAAEGTQLTYVVNFYVAGDDATLSDLTVDGVTIPGFDPDIFDYDYQVETGSPIPVVGAVATDSMATLVITQASTLPDTATVFVTSEDSLHNNTYTVNFLYTPNDDATLSDLLVDGNTIEGFAPDVFNYTYGVIVGDFAPFIEGIPADPNATVVDTQSEDVPGDATSEVTAEDTITALTYTVSFYYLGNDATLSDLTVDGVTIPGFDPDTLYYRYLVNNPDSIPWVDGTTADSMATLTVTQATEIPGDATLHVVAEDGIEELTYTVHFYTLASDATLADLTVDGQTIEGFSPAIYEYEYDVLEGQDIPLIDGTPTDSLASKEVTQATEIPGDGIIVVTAQDDTTQLTYTVHFKLITAIDNQKENLILLYPNPVSGQMYFSGLKGEAQIEIINLQGKTVFNGIIKDNQGVDLHFLGSGIYFAVIRLGDRRTQTEKFVKR